MRILVVEDEADVASFIRLGLAAENFAVDCAFDGSTALSLVTLTPYDAIVLDLMLPKKGGLEILRELRTKNISTPIVVLSGLTEQTTKIEALNSGADDYLTKPFAFNELLARIRALLRRERHVASATLRIADLELDVAAHTVHRAGRLIKLRKKEFELLEYFMHHPGVLLTRIILLEHVWDMNSDPFTNTVDVHVRSLRRKICKGFSRKLIHTIRGYGYKLE